MYSEMFELQAQLLKALAHSRRLEIIQLLRGQSLSVSEIYEMLDLPQANISQHLMILRDAGVVKTKREGKQIIYQIADLRILEASDALREVLIDQNKHTNLAQALSFNMKDMVPVVHDPVCQMRVSPKTAGGIVEYQGHHYYFCASGCSKKFMENPQTYV